MYLQRKKKHKYICKSNTYPTPLHIIFTGNNKFWEKVQVETKYDSRLPEYQKKYKEDDSEAK